MQPINSAQLKKLEKLANVLDNGDMALLAELDTLESRIERVEDIVPALREAKDGEMGPRGEKGEPGESIVGPMGPAGRDGVNGRDGKDSTVPGPVGPRGEKGDSIIGPAGRDGKDGFVDEATVAYLEDEVKKAKLDKEAYDRALGIVDQRTSFSINKASNLERDKVTGVGVHTLTVGATAPSAPGDGDVWLDVNGTTSATAWGGITGTLSAQTDLVTELNRRETLAIAYAVAL